MSDNSEPKQPAPENKTVSKIIDAFINFYRPTGTGEPELKTTIELVEEMATVADVSKWELQLALQQAGFTISYCESGPFWVLYAKKGPQG